MEQLYLEFDKEEFEKNLELFKRLRYKKNGDLKEAFTLFADRYIKGKIDLPIFLQLINYTKKHNLVWEEKEILPVVLKIKDYHEKRNEKIDINIYELLIYIYYYYHNDK